MNMSNIEKNWRNQYGACRQLIDGRLQCMGCKQWFPASEHFFYVNQRRRFGFESVCRDCYRAKLKHTTKRRWAKTSSREGCFVCTKCGTEKELNYKNFDRCSNNKSGFKGVCKTCRKTERAKANTRKFRKIVDGNIFCNGCKKWLPATIEYFMANKNDKLGFYYKCKECMGHKFGIIKGKRYDSYGNVLCTKCRRYLPCDKGHFGFYADGKPQSHCKECQGSFFGFHVTYTEDGKLKCNYCNELFPATAEFFHRCAKAKYGFRPYCKACMEKRRPTQKPRIKTGGRVPRKIVDGKLKCNACGEWFPATTEYFTKLSGFNPPLNHKCKKCYRKNMPINAIIAAKLRGGLRQALKSQGVRKTNSVLKLLGCDVDAFKVYFGSLFTEGMSWGLFEAGKLEIDHRVPLAYFDLSDPEQQAIAFRYDNLQPMFPFDNKSKNSFVNGVKLYHKRH